MGNKVVSALVRGFPNQFLPDADPGHCGLKLKIAAFDDDRIVGRIKVPALKPAGKVLLLEYRLDGDTARHIKIDHRMSVKQVKSEWLPAGFELLKLEEFLPSQHLFIFGKAKPKEK